MKKVRVNRRYKFKPVMIDKINPPYGVINGTLKEGNIVKVINKHGCPKANTMGHCYIEVGGLFGGLVCVNSLVDL